MENFQQLINRISNENDNKFEGIKSKYNLKQIFANLKRVKLLKIIKYNKAIQKRLHTQLNDYKKYIEIYSPIEIEIIPNQRIGKLINIKTKEAEKYFHIYFDDYEIKRYSLIYIDIDYVKKIKIKIDYQIKSFYELFKDCNSIKSIYFKKFYRNDIINMNSMFHSCYSLKEINFTNFNTNNVTNMGYMFYGCSSLEKLNLSNFNTINVTSMYSMFYKCSSLKELDISNFNTNNVINMGFMFSGCSLLKELNISNLNTNKVKKMSGMFQNCSSLKELNLSNFSIISNESSLYNLFGGCNKELITHIKKEYSMLANNLYLI